VVAGCAHGGHRKKWGRTPMRTFWRGLALAGAASALAPAAAAADTYVVQLKAPALASYTGGTKGIAATSPLATGARHLNVKSAAARQYAAYLAGRQAAALARVPGKAPQVSYRYRVALAGFAADLTTRQVAALRKAPEVAHVFRDFKLHTQAVDPDDPNSVDAALGGPTGGSAAYLGLPKGLWNALGGPNHAGENVIVGDIDTGITPQSPSFADHAAGNYVGNDYGPPPARWQGACAVGPNDANFHCNNKLIGARFYVTNFGVKHVAAGSFLSPRDDDGHGSNTSSIAAGNFGVDPSIEGNDLGIDVISGMAPRALIAEYKACWVGGDVPDGCDDTDLAMAIDDAVADGVDVINFSIGGPGPNGFTADEAAFLGAADAGVFVATSAGNDGPGAQTIESPTRVPWVTSTAAENPARTFTATAHIVPSSGQPFDITGASVTAALNTPTQVVDAADSAAAGADPAEAELCFPDSLDPAKVAGKIVLCLRGANDRIEKSQVVKAAGGVGMILYNPNAAQDTDTDIHWVPSVHVSKADGLKVKQAIAAGTTMATIGNGHATLGTPKVLAAFSSRGPSSFVADLPKPDLTAPGVNILGAGSPDPAVHDFPHGDLFLVQSGTSQASPHVAGSAALLKQAHPDWSPAEIKSALMETANTSVLKEDGTSPATPFDQGSGEIDPTKAANPGLVLDENTDDYLGYVESQGFDLGVAPVQASDLNLASIGNSAVVGRFQTTRTFTSVDSAPRTWTASLSVPGFTGSATAGPGGSSTFTIAPGAAQALTITATRTTAPLRQWAFGALTLTSGATTLHLPVSLRPLAVRAPGTLSVSTDKLAGSQPFSVTAGYDGTLNVVGFGLAAPSTHPGQHVTTTDGDGSPDPTTESPSNRFYDLTVPAGAQLLSGRIANSDGDLDLFLFHDANKDGKFTGDELIDASATPAANEGVTEVDPAAGAYRFVVVGFDTQDPSTFDFSTWVVNDPAGDDATGGPGIAVTGDPFAVTAGQTVQPTLQWNNVLQTGLYLGVVEYDDGTGQIGTSVVELDKTAASATGGVSGTVPATLALTLGPPASFGPFTPGVDKTYSTSTSATVTSTAGNALLTVSDPDTAHPGHLVNGAYFLAQPLQMRARDSRTQGTAFNPIGSSFNLLSWDAPISSDPVTLDFQQAIGRNEALRTGTYGKTLTFTLSTTQP
jgi:subtilisin family serine protease